MTHRPWDSYDAYLFDIDGTLLHCTDAVHYFAFCNALTRTAGRPLNLDGVVAHGNTDVGILRDAFARADVPQSAWRPRLAEVRTAMCAEFERNRHELCAEVLPHVEDVLLHLKARGAVLGVATGNLADIGRIKLEHCGLLRHFDFGAYSDAFEYRKDVFAAGLRQARELVGEHAAVCAVGDTPSDVQAARENGIDVIAVATGVYTHAQLTEEKPTRCIRSFAEFGPFVSGE